MNDNVKLREYLERVSGELYQTRQRLRELEERRPESVALVGMACRFPGGVNSPSDYWRNLIAGVDATSEVPADRWDMDAIYDPSKGASGKAYTRRGAFISDLGYWDAEFFGNTPQEAFRLDPQHRLIMEVVWEALEDAGITPEKLRDARTGIFLGLADSEQYKSCQIEAEGPSCFDDPSFLMGGSSSAAAGRIAYFLDVHGPCMSIDTACSSALTATHLAIQSLRAGDCDTAIVSSGAAIISRYLFVQMCKLSMLAVDGRCKTFDAAADGFAMGEGGGAIVLQRTEQAIADRSPVYALIRGSAVSQDGQTNGLTAPSREAQVNVLRAALLDAGLRPAEIGFVEAHGSGTSLGDAIEFSALRDVFNDRSSEWPLLVGAAKSHVGHLLASAGMAGLIKTVLSLTHGEVPANLHLVNPNPAVTLDGTVRPVTSTTPFPVLDGEPRRAGVSGFGWSGTNVHLIVEQAAPEPQSPSAPAASHLLTLSARNTDSLRDAAAVLADHLEDRAGVDLADVAYTTQTGRAAFPVRRALLCRDVPDATFRLRAFADDGTAMMLPTASQMGLLLTGTEQESATALRLCAFEQAFEQAYDECVSLARDLLGVSLEEAPLTEKNAQQDSTSRRLTAFASAYALARLLEAYGLHPSVLLAYGPGAHVAGCIAGVFDLAGAICLVAGPDKTAEVQLHAPEVGLLNPMTGALLTSDEAMDSAYWARVADYGDPSVPNVIEAARYADVMIRVSPAAEDGAIGARGERARDVSASRVVEPLFADDDHVDRAAWLVALGRLWERGLTVNWAAGHPDSRNLLRLPTYRFRRTRFWPIGAPHQLAPATAVPMGVVDGLGAGAVERRMRFYASAWRRQDGLPGLADLKVSGTVVVLAGEGGFGEQVAGLARSAGDHVVVVERGSEYRWQETSASIDPAEREHYVRLFTDVSESLAQRENGSPPVLRVLHTFAHAVSADAGGEDAEAALDAGFHSVIALVQALGRVMPDREVDLVVGLPGAFDVVGGDMVRPLSAMVVGLCRSIAAEYPQIHCRCVDVESSAGPEPAARELLHEFALPARLNGDGGGEGAGTGLVSAWRRGRRWLPSVGQVQLPEVADDQVWRHGAVYVITGGTGGLGLALARRLAALRARLVLIGRTALPPPDEWEAWLAEHPADDAVSEIILAVREMRAAGADVLTLAADVADRTEVERAFRAIRERFGHVFAVIHAAGVPGAGLLQSKTREQASAVLAPKVAGTLNLARELRADPPELFVLYSSVVTAMGSLGEGDYGAANAFLDAFAVAEDGAGTVAERVVSVGWGPWEHDRWQVGDSAGVQRIRRYRDEFGITGAEGIEALGRVIAAGSSHMYALNVPLADLSALLHSLLGAGSADGSVATAPAEQRFPRPELRVAYSPPRSGVERRVAETWQQLLGIDKVGIHDPFFDLGGTSLVGIAVIAKLNAEFTSTLSAATVIERPTVAQIAELLDGSKRRDENGTNGSVERGRRRRAQVTGLAKADIALVGMAGRFPGAGDVWSLWRNLRAGRDSIARFSEQELRAEGVPDRLLADPAYVRAGAVLEGIDLFDAGFFGFSPKEAQLLDPQQRLFLESSWEAMEDAAVDPGRFDGAIGVVAGAGLSTYMMQNLQAIPDLTEIAGIAQMVIASDKDSLATRVAHALDATGPCYSIQSYCSTSLVAVSVACSMLVSGEADLVLAGGVQVLVPHRVGYLYEEGGMHSPDGLCRALDASAQGTPVGSGVGVVALRRLEDAVASGDRIYAVIRGWAVNNDGADKGGFTAPGVRGQAGVIAEALASAGLSPSDIDYVEMHGTGTRLGDAVEISAMQQVFGAERASCAIGSAKSNLGHLDRAAGVTGLIKAALSLYREEIPATVNFERPNPQLERGNGGLQVVRTLQAWPRGERKRRAGISAFGIGGTNAHVVLEEAGLPAPDAPSTPRDHQLLVWSARTREAADAASDRLRQALAGSGEDCGSCADVAFTLQTGRAVFEHRRALVATSKADAADALGQQPAPRVLARQDSSRHRPVGFLLAGVGEQYQGMVGGLYRSEPVFRAAIDECAEVFQAELGMNPTEMLLGERRAPTGSELARLMGRQAADGDADPADTVVTQPAMFAADYAMGRLLMSWGMVPRILLGYSVGEFVAACLSGSLTAGEAARLVAHRARLISQLPCGTMTVVSLSVAELNDLVGSPADAGVDVAAVNGPKFTVLAGPGDAVQEISHRLAAMDVPCRDLLTTHAFHSRAMRPVAAELTAWIRSELRPRAPQIPYLSNLTGTVISQQQLRDPGYWAEHMCSTVQFDTMIQSALSEGDHAFVEIGPGQSLAAMTRNHPACPRERWGLLVPTLPAQADPSSAETVLTNGLAQLWLAGINIDWHAYHHDRNPHKTELPAYPFQRQRYWLNHPTPPATAAPAAAVLEDQGRDASPGPDHKQDASPELMVPRWIPGPRIEPVTSYPQDAPVWIFGDRHGVAQGISDRLTAAGQSCVLVVPDSSADAGPARMIRPDEVDDYRDLLASCAAPCAVVHLWGLDLDADDDPVRTRAVGFDSVRALTEVLGTEVSATVPVLVATRSALLVQDGDQPVAERATVFGPCLVAPQEYLSLRVRAVDVTLSEQPESQDAPVAIAEALHNELRCEEGPGMVALRGGTRLVPDFIPVPSEGSEDTSLLEHEGTYLITGGLGPIGLLLAEHLGVNYGARLVLTSRVGLPPRDEWESAVPTTGSGGLVRERIEAIRRLEEQGISVDVVVGDVTDEVRLREIVHDTAERHGRLSGVIHLAAVNGVDGYKPLADLTPDARDTHFQPKIDGVLALERVLADVPVGFCLLFSSLSTVLGGAGFAGYSAADSFLDGVVHRHSRDATPWLTVNWDTWQPAASSAGRTLAVGVRAAYSLSRQQALEAFDQILADPRPRTAVSAGDLVERMRQWTWRVSHAEPTLPTERLPRPDLAQQYVPPVGERQRDLAELVADLLAIERVGARDNFFDLGGTSLMSLQLAKELRKKFGVRFSPISLFEAPTVSAMAQLIEQHDQQAAPAEMGSRRQARRRQRRTASPGSGQGRIAIIGMAGRFPGARDTAAFWQNLRNGVESVQRFSEEELLATGVSPDRVSSPSYVPARPVLDDIRTFDAEFFGYSPRDAEITDPQHRIFLECCWEALEHSGYGVPKDRGRVGVYAGTNISTYLIRQVSAWPGGILGMSEVDGYAALIGNDKDSLSTGIAYKLGLTGPSLAVQAFCSTSLVATHLACQGLRAGECEMAIAGGVGVQVPDRIGHLYMPGSMETQDGKVHAFDAAASGTIFGDGAGVVVLKRLDDALVDGDPVHAVIRGSAVNNDGSLKVGFTAPSVVGQAIAVTEAMQAAGVTAEDIGYVEAHGTGTPLGDPIEVTALTRAYGATKRKQYCPIGSVKTNVGHLAAAAGASGLIKTVLTLSHREIPPSLNFDQPNPEIDFADSPFYVNTKLTPWQVPDGRRRIAGLNSLGMGGTNVHMVIEEAPEPEPRRRPELDRRWEILPMSGRTEKAADAAVRRVAEHLRAESGLDMVDVAYTLQAGRERFRHRRVLVINTTDGLRMSDAVGADGQDGLGEDILHSAEEMLERPVDFLFAGVGEQYPGLVGELYAREPTFRSVVDECAAILGNEIDADLVGELTAPRWQPGEDGGLLAMMGRGDARREGTGLVRTEVAQPAMFVAEYAQARLLMSWGIQPATMLGYSLGEYVAACLAGVFSLREALSLVAFRAKLISQLPPGAMLAVPLSPERLRAEHGDPADHGVDVAVINGLELTVVGGETEAVDTLAAKLASASVPARRLVTSHAYHTRMMDPAAAELTAWVKANLDPQPPRLPYVSNITGRIATDELVTDPEYWAKHMCSTVHFADGLAELLADPDPVLVELGPGQSLGAIARTHPDCSRERWPLIISTLPASADQRPDDRMLTEAIARMWLAGVNVDWTAYQQGRDARRIPLPTYPFQRKEYWLEPEVVQGQTVAPTLANGTTASQEDIAALAAKGIPMLPEEEWLHACLWRQTVPYETRPAPQTGRWLILTDQSADALCRPLVRRLIEEGGSVVLVRPDADLAAVEQTDDGYRMRPGDSDQVRELLRSLRDDGGLPDRIIHLWSLGDSMSDSALPIGAGVEDALRRGADTLIAFATASQDVGSDKWELNVVTSGTRSVTGTEQLRPEWCTLIGPVRSIPLEYPGVCSRLIDIDWDHSRGDQTANLLALEFAADGSEPLVAFRNGRRWIPGYESLGALQLRAEDAPLRHGGVYLVTGGLGGIGLAMAERMARDYQAKIVLLVRTGLPPRETWQDALADPAASDEARRRLTGVLRLEELGSEVAVVVGDVSDVAAARNAVRTALDRFGALHGVLHVAGVPGIGLMQFKTITERRKVLDPKVRGVLALESALEGIPLDFVALFSGNTTHTGGGPGQADYSAANAFLDAYAEERTRVGGVRRTLSISWSEWQWNAWEAGLVDYESEVQDFLRDNRRRFGIEFEAGWRSLLRALSQEQPYVIVSTQDFADVVRLGRYYTVEAVNTAGDKPTGDRHPRPDLVNEFAPPEGETETAIASVWADMLGLAEIGVNDNFFDLGGNSLVGMGVMARIRRKLNVAELAPHVLYEAPTVASLARLVAGGATGQRDGAQDKEGDRAALRRQSLRRPARRGRR